MRDTIGNLFPAAFCAAISIIVLWANSGAGGTNPVFLAFLPVCFVMMGLRTLGLQREIGDLRRELRDLEAKRS